MGPPDTRPQVPQLTHPRAGSRKQWPLLRELPAATGRWSNSNEQTNSGSAYVRPHKRRSITQVTAQAGPLLAQLLLLTTHPDVSTRSKDCVALLSGMSFLESCAGRRNIHAVGTAPPLQPRVSQTLGIGVWSDAQFLTSGSPVARIIIQQSRA